jgi:hypothetical protein
MAASIGYTIASVRIGSGCRRASPGKSDISDVVITLDAPQQLRNQRQDFRTGIRYATTR